MIRFASIFLTTLVFLLSGICALCGSSDEDLVITQRISFPLTTQTYDKAGNRRATEYGATARTITSNYDKLNRLLTLTENGTIATSFGYDLGGNVTRKTLPNGSTTFSTFDALNRKLSETSRT